ncbi:MAG: glycosyltransferase family 4 protein [Sedimentisphaerales bacterium]|nr:glycosyltransferase family 4 protein [Sedimentisphaerales bacterium]
MNSTIHKPLRILHLIPHLSGGGAERQMAYLSGGLVDRGHEIHVAYLTKGPDSSIHLSDRIHFHRLSCFNNHNPRILWKLLCLVHRIAPDIMQTWNPQMDILGGLAFQRDKSRWVLREPSCSQAWSDTWKIRLRILIARRASVIVANSRAGCQYWSGQRPNVPRMHISNGMPLEVIDRVEPINAATYGISSHQKVVLYAGRLSHEKNLSQLLPVLAQANKNVPFVFVFCGVGPLDASLRRQVESLGVQKTVFFEGMCSQRQVWAWMKRADVLVSLSQFEGCPNTVLEAMACWCRVLVSDIPAHRELLDQSTAEFVDPHDAHQMESTLMKMLQEKYTNNRIQKARKITERMTVEHMVDQYEKLYKQVLEGEYSTSSLEHKIETIHPESFRRREKEKIKTYTINDSDECEMHNV